jgi:hypothetical protein
VTVVVVGFGSSQNIEELGRYQDENTMPFVFTQGPDDMVRTFAVTTQSTKFGITRDGVIESSARDMERARAKRGGNG